MTKLNTIRTEELDFLIIGSGIAGLSIALKASTNTKIGILNKSSVQSGASNWAQGGIASAVAPDDSPEIHVEDTLAAGDGLCQIEPVKILAAEGPNTIRSLIEWGVQFTKDNSQNPSYPYHLALEGGHSRRRILHSDDFTGKEVMRALVKESQQRNNIQYYLNHSAIDLVIDKEGRCAGAIIFDSETKSFTHLKAKVTFMATGGVGQVFKYTTNPNIATGDGLAMAYRAGAQIEDMEFMQFHPTGFYNPGHRIFLISEAVRGHGAILRNHLGEAFMKNEHPLKDLAPRDVVARAIDKQLKKYDLDNVYLDITHHSRDELINFFPNIYKHLEEMGFAMEKDLIPVVPSAHYVCGGIKVNTQAESSIPSLFALGECSCTGVHGANRLASNSLLESVVFADRALNKANSLLENDHSSESNYEIPENIDQTSGQLKVQSVLKKIMWKKVGIVRNNSNLKSALKELTKLEVQVEQLHHKRGFSLELNEITNMIQVGKMITFSALNRKESRGLHFSLDYPQKSDAEKTHHSFNKSDLT
jgi:L-aspartate oxidase